MGRDLRDSILDYVKDAYSKREKVPSVRQIKKKFRINNREFYSLFSDKRKLCKEASVPTDEESFERARARGLANPIRLSL